MFYLNLKLFSIVDNDFLQGLTPYTEYIELVWSLWRHCDQPSMIKPDNDFLVPWRRTIWKCSGQKALTDSNWLSNSNNSHGIGVIKDGSLYLTFSAANHTAREGWSKNGRNSHQQGHNHLVLVSNCDGNCTTKKLDRFAKTKNTFQNCLTFWTSCQAKVLLVTNLQKVTCNLDFRTVSVVQITIFDNIEGWQGRKRDAETCGYDGGHHKCGSFAGGRFECGKTSESSGHPKDESTPNSCSEFPEGTS